MARRKKEENAASSEETRKSEEQTAENTKTQETDAEDGFDGFEEPAPEPKRKREKRERKPPSPDALLHQLLPIILVALAAFFGVCIYTQVEMGALGALVSDVFCGLLGGGAYLFPVWLLLSAILWRRDVRADAIGRRQIFGFVLILIASILFYTFGMPEAERESFGEFYRLGGESIGGGVLGGVIGFALDYAVSTVGTVIVCAALLLILFLIAYGRAFSAFVVRLFGNIKTSFVKMRERRLRAEEQRATEEAMRRAGRIREEESFYDISPAIRAGVEQTETGAARTGGTEADRRVNRQLYDVVAEDGAGAPAPAEVPAAPASRPSPPARLPAGSRSFFDAEELEAAPPALPDEIAAALGGREARPAPSPQTDAKGFHLVGTAPIPPNRATPFGNKVAKAEEEETPAVPEKTAEPIPAPTPDPKPERKPKPKPAPVVTEDEEKEEAATEEAASDGEGEDEPSMIINRAHVVEHIGAESFASEDEINKYAADTFFYSFPPLSLLRDDDPVNQEDSDMELRIKGDKLRETLENFGIHVTIKEATRGPRLTRYELVPEPGTRISKIENLVDEITMNLEAISVRIEAPIPGKAAIGVEVPNINTSTVRLRGLLDTDTFRDAPGKTTVCLGVDVIGKPVFADLEKMPHLLVAGATGMGKSVCINSLLVSLLYKARPDEVKLILIDPKKVEFQSYANIPHLLVPVVTEPQKAAGALAWAVGEMERRYDLIESAAVRNIAAYNKTVDDHPGRTRMSQIVIVIDELHDLMLQARDAVEDSIARIAAKARAAGILLIIGTQRPSVNVITGVIKANIPSRIAFHVASQVDSRTILDAVGAEKLLNNGDMLFLSPGMKMLTPKRVQGAFLDDDEVNRVADYLRKNSSAVQYDESVMADMERESEKCNKDKRQGGDFGSDEEGGGGSEDELFYKAVEVAFESGKISTSLLQRRLSVGFGKASRLIDRMQDMGIVSKPNGQKPRDILISLDEYRAMRLRHDE